MILFLKLVLWVVIAFAVIPFGIFVLFLNIFPDLTPNGFWFWAVFASFNVIAYYFLWKPVVWVVTTITESCEGNKVTEHSSFRERC